MSMPGTGSDADPEGPRPTDDARPLPELTLPHIVAPSSYLRVKSTDANQTSMTSATDKPERHALSQLDREQQDGLVRFLACFSVATCRVQILTTDLALPL